MRVVYADWSKLTAACSRLDSGGGPSERPRCDSGGENELTKPKNEQARLGALEKYAILDTDPEAAFDDLTLLASFVCKTPIALDFADR